MVYQTLGIRYIASKNYDDYEITPHFATSIYIDVLQVVKSVQKSLVAPDNLTSSTNKKLDYRYSFFKMWKKIGKYGQVGENRKDVTLTLENKPPYLTFHWFAGEDIDEEFDDAKINIFANLLPIRITQFNIFDDFNDPLGDTQLGAEDTQTLKDNIYRLVAVVVYARGHYYNYVYNDDNWVMYDDKLVVQK